MLNSLEKFFYKFRYLITSFAFLTHFVIVGFWIYFLIGIVNNAKDVSAIELLGWGTLTTLSCLSANRCTEILIKLEIFVPIEPEPKYVQLELF